MSLCGFACCHCGRCGTDAAERFGITSIAGKCLQCGAINGPRAEVCKDCGALLENDRTEAVKANSKLSSPSLLRRDGTT